MMKSRRIVGLGEGLRARKAVDLSIRHARDEFTAVDSHPKRLYGSYLLEKGLRQKPANLNVLSRTDAARFLQAQKPESIDHLYAHFLLQHLSFSARQRLFSEIMRTLKPGSRFATVEDIHYSIQLRLELQKQGFQVFSKRISARDLLKLKTDNADMNARVGLEREMFLNSLAALPREVFRRIQPDKKVKNVEELKQADIEEVREQIRQKLEKREGKKPSPEAKQAINRILAGLSERYSEKPFVVIIAKKLHLPRPKK